MTVHWGSLLAVFVVSFGTMVAVVALVTLALVGLSARGVPTASTGLRTRPDGWSPRTGTAVAVAGLSIAALVVLAGLWEIVAR